MSLTRSESILLVFTLGYIGAFLVHFLTDGNTEFVSYIVTLVFFVALIVVTQKFARFPSWLLWALSAWGLAHMAGGGIPVGDDVLYAAVLVPLAGEGEMTVLKYDQLVHFCGFGITALVLRHVLRRNFPEIDGTKTLFAFAVLGSMGLGALNEIIEFTAVVALPDTNVGGYYNTGLDLVFNALGALTATAGAIAVSGRR